jgi:hypothetical protein
MRPRKAGRKPRLDEEMLRKIAERIKEVPDIALKERIEEFSLPVSVPAFDTANDLQQIGMLDLMDRLFPQGR